ncbi:MAG: carnitine dehydratase [Rhodospirillaceae bacterium]|nr:carnitine dehydratase [Rhodospirillaceae bacterium]MDG1886341.1 CaiB/BaiF CoA-transferase family protein [Alphaproteobacteria bacterium]|tara:strand:+ start:1156 stop:2280 length:1125 start_codon:yes stop_codon:yes gene_type:complete
MGPLDGFKILELAGIGPGPMAAMLLADMGATVLRVERLEPAGLGVQRPLNCDITLRSRKAIALDLKTTSGVKKALQLVEKSDALIEGFRPGVTERLGLGPNDCFAMNPKLVYGRMTGFGQNGPMAQAAGHDLNYIAMSGALAAIGRSGQKPTPPLNLVGDYGGGALYLVVGVLAALLEAQKSGKGQVVDAAMVDGAASLMAAPFGMFAAGLLTKDRGSNVLDSGAYFYDSYECLDGKFVSIAAIESKFHSEMFSLMELDISLVQNQMDREHWPRLKKMMEEKFKTKTRDEWTSIMGGSDACFAPVLEMDEVAEDPHNAERETFINIDGVTQPAPAPRFSRTPNPDPTPPIKADMIELEDALDGWLSTEEISLWR